MSAKYRQSIGKVSALINEKEKSVMTEVSVVIPTKNEEASTGTCIEKIRKVFAKHHIDGEIVVADNSTDRTPEIAKHPGVRVVVPDELGYGNAYRFGFAQASGDYIVMGDADNTYDFMDTPGLLEPLKGGEADLVMVADSMER